MFLDILEYRIEGNSLLGDSFVQRVVSPFLGYTRSSDDVNKAAKALQDAYRDLGYPAVFVEIPDQDVLNGVVTLKVVESQIRRVRISGSRYFSLNEIREKMPTVTEGNVLHLPTLQAEIERVNKSNNDLNVVPVIKRSPIPAMVDLELSVDDSVPFHGGITLNNYYSSNTSPTRLGVDFSYRNLWQKNHSFSMQAQKSPENTDEVDVLSASYSLPVGIDGKKLSFDIILSDSDVATSDGINNLGHGKTLGFRYLFPFMITSSTFHNFSVGFDYKDVIETTVGEDVRDVPIDYIAWSGAYDFFGRRDNTRDSFSSSLTLGMRGLLDGDKEFDEKRSEAAPNFVVLQVDWRREYDFQEGWMLSHQLRLQLSDSPLISNEQFSAGGVNTVRGYLESQVQADLGVVANIELHSPDLTKHIDWMRKTRASIFIDGASMKLKDALPEQEDSFNIASYGLSLRSDIAQFIKLKVDGGVALKEEGEVNKGSFRTRASVRFEF